MYLTYDKYQEMGGTMPEAEYPMAERRARALLDDWTLGRVKRLETVPEEVELAMYEIVDRLGDAYEVNNVSSFGNGVNSIGFTSASDQRAELFDLVQAILPIELISAAVHYNAR